MSKELDQYREAIKSKIADVDRADTHSWLGKAKHEFFKHITKQDVNALDLRNEGQITHEEYIASAAHFIDGFIAAKAIALGIRKED